MPGPHHCHLSRPELEKKVLNYATNSYPYDVPQVAIQGASTFNDLQEIALDEQAFDAMVTDLIALLDVPFPAMPEDLSEQGQTREQLEDAADAMFSAIADFNCRANALNQSVAFWVKANGAGPTHQQFIARFKVLANTLRAPRGLDPIV